jgi:hypothetical protein
MESNMTQSQQTFMYGIQWIDHGGVFDEPNFDTYVYDIIEQLGLQHNNIIEIGGVHYVDGNTEYYPYIKTNVELPEWIGSINNLKANQNRYCQHNQLWFYNFELNQHPIERTYSLSEFDELYFGL